MSHAHHRLAALILTLAFAALSIAPVRAGTTGSLSGAILDADTGKPIAGAAVTANSPSQRVSTHTDAGGHFSFVSLTPDDYTLIVAKDGFATESYPGVIIFADATQVVTIKLRHQLKTIANVTSRSSGDLVRAGTTADVYSVNAAQQSRASALGGGGDLNSAYSAIASVPGAYVPTNQNGYNQAVHVRGGDSSEVGYEFDGIPVNRGFDNYPSGSASSLGQLELQVYTGATPADAEAQGLAGFINQVIKTGTSPGFADADWTVGAPTFYHSLNVEAGGATPDRLFSYYAGIGGFNQDHRYVDQWDGAAYANQFGPPLDQCPTAAPIPPSCLTNGLPNVSAAGAPGYILGPIPFGNDPSGILDRTAVFNFHFAIPHKHGGMRDDVQLLYDSDMIQTPLYVSALDEGLQNFYGTLYYPPGTTPYYTDSYQYTGKLGSFFSNANVGQVAPYYFPSSPTNRPMFASIPLNTRDVQYNNQEIVKLQYQRNFSGDAYFRIYGYTYYSDYVGTGAVSSWQPLTGYDSGDYELNSHTRGLSASFVKQFNSANLVQLEGSYVTATSLRMNNSTMFGSADGFAVLVNPNDLKSGTCYALPAGTGTPYAPSGAAVPSTCGTGNAVPINAGATFASLAGTYGNGALSDSSGNVFPSGAGSYTCGGSPCSFYTVENGISGEYNTVTPVFTGAALTDEWRPNDRLVVNAGVRFDQYQYRGDNTTGTAARAFWFNAANNDYCYNSSNLSLVDKSTLEAGTFSSSTPCSTFGTQYQGLINANGSTNAYSFVNTPSQIFTYDELQPRIGATFTFDPDTTIRASFGKYIEQPSAAYEQYDTLTQNLPDQLAQFYALGFRTPGHAVRPPVSYNADFSYERHFKGTDMAMKITPFLRQTHDQIENFYLNIKQGFISGLNAGNQTSDGVEFALTKGDFGRDGFAAQLGFAYTNAYIKFDPLPNGTTILSPINADIQNYNGFTSYCFAHQKDPRCGIDSTNASPCYAGGLPSACGAAGAVANPYWNAPVQGLLDPNGHYLPYSTIPGGIGTGVNAYNYPYVATLILQWKHRKLAVTPSFQFVAGNRYGAPETTPGVDPSSCSALAGAAPDPARYPYGAAGGSAYDATTCANTIVIPDPYTKQFDGLGAFREPAQLLGHLRISYDISPRLTATVTMANLISTCFGGQQTAFTYFWSKNVCSYGPVDNGIVSPVGNVYNPGDNVQTNLAYPYEPSFGTYNDLTSSTVNPFSVYFDLKVRM